MDTSKVKRPSLDDGGSPDDCRLNWNDMDEQDVGTYADNDGNLVRVFDGAAKAGNSPNIMIDSKDKRTLTRVSSNPTATNRHCATILASNNIQPNFDY